MKSAMQLCTMQFFQQRKGIKHWRDQIRDGGHLHYLNPSLGHREQVCTANSYI